MVERILRQTSFAILNDQGNKTSQHEVVFADGRQYTKTIYTDTAMRRTVEVCFVDANLNRTTDTSFESAERKTRTVSTMNADGSFSEEVWSQAEDGTETVEHRNYSKDKKTIAYKKTTKKAGVGTQQEWHKQSGDEGHIIQETNLSLPSMTGLFRYTVYDENGCKREERASPIS